MSFDFKYDPFKHARKSDPVTSHAAAKSAVKIAGSHRERILDALNVMDGSQSDIAAATGLLPHQVNKRLADLQDDGLIEPTGYTKKGHAGREERIWRRV